jgi:uncharacterized protein (AIM24 family)
MKPIGVTSGQQWTVGNVEIHLNEYSELKGSKNIQSARNIDAANKAGMKLKYIYAKLSNGKIRTEPGMLHYMQGQLELSTSRADGSTGLGGYFMNKVKSGLSGESSSNTEISGTGFVALEPTFGHYVVIEMNNESFIADKGIYCASAGEVLVDVAMQKNISSALFGGEGLFQTEVKGTGLGIFNCPVHPSELVRIDLNNDCLKVDGSFAILRSSSLQFTAERSAKSFYSTYKSGEGILQTFRGTGTVWLAPTESFYKSVQDMHVAKDLGKNQGSDSNADGLTAKTAKGIIGKLTS